MRSCDACGSGRVFVSMGGASLCRDCEPGIRLEMEQLREAGKSVNVLHIAKRIYRETFSGGDYLLRDVPKELWLQAKHRALDEGISVRDMILEALRRYLA